jgi:U3 small nucleolar RNA-associated protein 14
VFVPASENPWLAVGSSSSAKVSRRKNEVVISKESSAGVKSQASLKKRLRKSDVAISREADDTVVEIDLSDVMVLPSSTTGSQLVATSKVSKGQPESDISDKAAIDVAFRHSDDEGDDVEERTQKGSKVFEQRDLVALAFAGDNIVEVRHSQCNSSVLNSY